MKSQYLQWYIFDWHRSALSRKVIEYQARHIWWRMQSWILNASAIATTSVSFWFTEVGNSASQLTLLTQEKLPRGCWFKRNQGGWLGFGIRDRFRTDIWVMVWINIDKFVKLIQSYDFTKSIWSLFKRKIMNVLIIVYCFSESFLKISGELFSVWIGLVIWQTPTILLVISGENRCNWFIEPHSIE